MIGTLFLIALVAAAGGVVAESALMASLEGNYEVATARRVDEIGQARAFATVADIDQFQGGHVVHAETASFVVEVFGEELTLDLTKNHDLFALGYVERKYGADGELVSEVAGRENCYYTGNVRGVKNSVVAMSTCDGLSGFIQLGRDSEEIHTEPAHRHIEAHADSNPGKRREATEIAQVFYRTADAGDAHDECPGGMDAPVADTGAVATDETGSRRRAANYIEWALVNDASQVAWCASDPGCTTPEDRAATLANNVQGRYLNTDGGMTTPVTVTLVEQRSHATDPFVVTTDAAATLANFLTWRNDAGNEFDKNNNDAAHLLSHVVFSGGNVGLAYSSTVCKSTGVALSRDRGDVAQTAHTMAHELGHQLSMTHDGAQTCTIMSACQCGQDCSGAGGTMDHWSQASKDAYEAYQATVTCMANDPNSSPCESLPPLGPDQTPGTCVAPTDNGGVCELGCAAGTMADGDLGTTCENGMWSPVSGTCHAPCPIAPTLPLANAGNCVPDMVDGTICTMVCHVPFLPVFPGADDSGSSADLLGLDFMCVAPDWIGPGPNEDGVCYFETALDTDGTTEIGTSSYVVHINVAETTGTPTLTLAGQTTCARKAGFVLTTEIVDINLVNGEFTGNQFGITMPFLPGITHIGRKNSALRYCHADGNWRKLSGGRVLDHDNNLITDNVPYMTSVAAWAKDRDGLFE